MDGDVAHIETLFQDGKDPNDACADQLKTTCQIEVEPGKYMIEFAGEDLYGLDVPSDEELCLAVRALYANINVTPAPQRRIILRYLATSI